MSRILGVVRDIVSARAFGTSWGWDAFIYAFMLPNFFRRVVGEGALSGAFIPVYSETLEKQGEEESFKFANITFCFLLLCLLGFTLLVEVVLFVLLGMGVEHRTIHLTLSLLRILFPYLICMSLYALGMGVLNSHKRFFIPSVGPVLLNVIWILAVIWLIPLAGSSTTAQLHWLAAAILFAGALHFLLEIPELYKLGFRFRWIWDVYYPGMKKLGKLLLPVVLSFAVVQINLLVDMTLAFFIGEGAASSLWYGTRLMQLPLGIFAIAVASALLPELSKQISARKMSESAHTLISSLRVVFAVILPACFGLMIFCEPIVHLLFERGEFDATSTYRTSSVLFWYSVGLFAYAGQKILVTGYYASQDSKTPMKIALVALVINVVFNLILMVPMKESGLALATSLSAIFQFFALLYLYSGKVTPISILEVRQAVMKLLFASLVMGLGSFGIYHVLLVLIGEGSVFREILTLLGTIASGVLIYTVVCFFIQAEEFGDILRLFQKKLSRS